MSPLRLHLAAAFAALALALAAGCHSSTQPTLNVLSVQRSSAAHKVVYVEVVNPARRPLRLQRLQYTFAAAGAPATSGVVELGARLVAAGSAVVVEVPLPDDASRLPAGENWTLAGRLWAEQDEIMRSFAVTTQVGTPGNHEPASP